MPRNFEFGCLPTVIGSMPHVDAEEACRLLLRYLPAIPAWPQLPRRSFTENMHAQFSEGFPEVEIESEHLYVDRAQNMDAALERLYADYQENALEHYAISADYASGFHALLNSKIEPPMAIKGQITGPVTWGLSVTDRQGRAVLYDETLADAVARHLRLKAAWQERALSQVSTTTIIFVDEPYLASLGTPFVSLPSEEAAGLLKEVLAGISGIKGIHCCGSAEWPLVLGLPIDVLSFDAYGYAESLSAYSAEVKSFLERGGAVAWGIVPNGEESLAKETPASLSDRLEEAMAPYTRDGVRFRQLLAQGLLTPSCGLAYVSPEAAEQALALLAELSERLRKRYL